MRRVAYEAELVAPDSDKCCDRVACRFDSVPNPSRGKNSVGRIKIEYFADGFDHGRRDRCDACEIEVSPALERRE